MEVRLCAIAFFLKLGLQMEERRQTPNNFPLTELEPVKDTDIDTLSEIIGVVIIYYSF